MNEINERENNAGISRIEILEAINKAIAEAKDMANVNWLRKAKDEVEIELEADRVTLLNTKHKEANNRMKVFSHHGFYTWKIATDSIAKEELAKTLFIRLSKGGGVPVQEDIHTAEWVSIADRIKFAIRPMLENYFVCEGIKSRIWEEQHKATLLSIKEFDEKTLAPCETLSSRYAKDWDFRVMTYNAYGKNIPIPKEVLLFIEKNRKDYPWKYYVKAFIEEYEKPIEENISTDEMKRWTVRHIDIEHGRIDMIPTSIFTKKIEDYGAEIAKAFKAWEFIVKNFPVYEKLYSNDCTQKPQYIINGSTIETLHPTLPIKTFKLKEGVTDATVIKYYDALINNKSIDCSIEEFRTVFSNESKLPDSWMPIRWLRVKEKKEKGTPHESGLAAIIIKLLDVKQSNPYIIPMSRFFVDKNGKSIKPPLQSSKSNLEKELPYIK